MKQRPLFLAQVVAMTNVQVFVRVRPLLQDELDRQCSVCIRAMDNQVIAGGGDRVFAFDGCFGQNSTSAAVMENVGVPLIESFLDRYNVTLLAYGQTGAGKTHTMRHMTEECFALVLNQLRQEAHRRPFRTTVGVLEIYNEQVIDLMADGAGGAGCGRVLSLREDETGVHAAGQVEHEALDVSSALGLFRSATRHRTTAQTNMNESSSRSHCICSLTVYLGGGGAAMKANFVDLAGSERMKKAHAGRANSDKGIREGIAINCGLLALGNVINAICDGKQFVPYRDSKLTRLLQTSLGGNSKTTMIACVSSADSSLDESLNTLKYAYRAKSIVTRPLQAVEGALVGEAAAATIRQLQEELEAARRLLADRGIAVVASTSSRYLISGGGDSEALKQYQAHVVTLEEDLIKERRVSRQLEEDLYRAEYTSMKLHEQLRQLEARVRGMEAADEALGATAPSEARIARVEEERNRLVAEQHLNEIALRQMTEQVTRSMSVESTMSEAAASTKQQAELAAEIEAKEQQLFELDRNHKEALSSLTQFQTRLGELLQGKKRLEEELLRAEARLEKAEADRTRREAERQLKASIEARQRAADIAISDMRRKIRDAEQTLRAKEDELAKLRRAANELAALKEEHVKHKEAAKVEIQRNAKLATSRQQEISYLQRQLKDMEGTSTQLQQQLRRKNDELQKLRQMSQTGNRSQRTEAAPPHPSAAPGAVSGVEKKLLAELSALAELELEMAAVEEEFHAAKSALALAMKCEDVNKLRRARKGWTIKLNEITMQLASCSSDSQRQQLQSAKLDLEERLLMLDAEEQRPTSLRLKQDVADLEDRLDSLAAAKQFHVKVIRSLQQEGPSRSPSRSAHDSTSCAADATSGDGAVGRLQATVTTQQRVIDELEEKLRHQAELLRTLMPVSRSIQR